MVQMNQNLEQFYTALGSTPYAKTAFAKRVAKRCNIIPKSVQNWCKGLNKPNDPEHYRILAEESGLLEENLFKDFDDVQAPA